MHIKYDSYNVVNSLDEGLLLSLKRDKAFPVMDSPYEPITGSSGDVIYSPIDIAFYNTEEFSKVGNHYLEHGVYTFLHPLYDKKEFDAFWDEEERKRKEGFTLPCSLITRGDGSYCLQDLHITGEHYGYLNYAPIKRVDESKLKELESYLLAGKDVKELGIEAKVTSLPQFFDSDYYYFKSVELARKVGKHLVVGKARRKVTLIRMVGLVLIELTYILVLLLHWVLSIVIVYILKVLWQ